MRVLVGCEYSGRVRDAFISKGHDAMSCDLLPTDVPGPHFEGDIFEAIAMKKWDLAIFFPPCTFLTNSANKWLLDQPPRASGKLVGEARREARYEAIAFFMALWRCGIDRVAIENPVGCMSTEFRKPNQVIEPWMFGHGETKATCLWTRNLPLLHSTKSVRGREPRIWKTPPGPNQWKIRSETYPGIAAAMADQWGNEFKTTLF